MTHNTYGGILPHILDLELKTLDENYTSLKDIIDNEVDEEIISAKYITETNIDDETYIRGCTIWTENSIYILTYTQIGYFFMKESRNP